MDKPDVDFIEGLSPAISIDQKSASRNPRSTVGTVTEVYDYLRLLYARIGKPHCPTCGRPVVRQSPQQIVDRILAMDEGTRFMVLAPVVRGRKGEYGALLDDLAKQGFARARVDGATVELADRAELDLARYEQHTIEVVVDRLVRRDDIRRRLTESLETALSPGRGRGRDRGGRRRRHRGGGHHLQPAPGLHPLRPELRRPRPPATSPSTRPTGPARPAPGSAPGSRSIPSWWCPTPPSRWPRGPWPRGRVPAASTSPGCGRRGRPGRLLARRPLGEAEKSDRKLVLYGAGDQAGPSQVPQPLRAPAVLPHPLRGHRPLAERRHTEAESDFLRTTSRAICGRCPARCAAGPGSGPSRWP